MKDLLKRFLGRCGYGMHRVPPGVVTGQDLARDLRLVIGSRPRPCCLDAGANDGSTIALLRGCLVSPVIHAFEPNPEIFAALQARCGALPDVRLVAAGLGETEGTLTLNLHPNHTLNSFLPLTEDGRTRLGAGPATATTVTVPVIRVDAYAAREGLGALDLLKVDTQGFDLKVLRGAKALFDKQQIRAVLVELDFAELYAGQPTPAEVIAFLQARGLRLVDFYEKCRHTPLLSWCTALFVRADAPPTA